MGFTTFVSVVVCLSLVLALTTHEDKSHIPNNKPLIFAHRGASGYVPEHTLGSYALAITLGADYLDIDLVITKDGHLVAHHINTQGFTTNVKKHPEFADRRRNQTIYGNTVTGWFIEDFTLNELKTLRVLETLPKTRPGNVLLDMAFTIPTFQEIIDLVKGMQLSQKRTIGICAELKISDHFEKIGLPLERRVVDILHKNGYYGPKAPVYIQSFEKNSLKKLKKMTNLKLMQLLYYVPLHHINFRNMATPNGLKKVASYAAAVGPQKDYIIPRNEENNLGHPTTFVEDAHAVGLKVYPFTFKAENVFLPNEFRISSSAYGKLDDEVKAYLETRIDGLFSDQPNIPLRVRDAWVRDEMGGE